jgi:hypothetical protein
VSGVRIPPPALRESPAQVGFSHARNGRRRAGIKQGANESANAFESARVPVGLGYAPAVTRSESGVPGRADSSPSSAPSVSRSYAHTPAWRTESDSARPPGSSHPVRNHGRCPGRPDRSVPRWVRPPRTASSPTSTRNETAIQLVSGCPCGHVPSHRNGLRTAPSARAPQPSDLTDDRGRIGSESNTAAPSDRDGMGERYAGLDIDRSRRGRACGRDLLIDPAWGPCSRQRRERETSERSRT